MEKYKVLQDIFDIDITTLKTPDAEAKKRVKELHGMMINVGNILYNDDTLIFLAPAIPQNWTYYGGFEYVEAEPDRFVKGYERYTILYGYTDNRIQRTLDALNGKEVSEEEEDNEDY